MRNTVLEGVVLGGVVLSLTFIFGCASPASFSPGQGKIGELRGEAGKSGKSSHSSGRHQRTRHGNYDYAWDSMAVTATGYIFALPFVLPIEILDDDNSGSGCFADYPYANNQRGYMANSGDKGKPWALHCTMGVGFDFDDDILRTAIDLELDTSSRFGLKLNHTYLQEELVNQKTDDTSLGDLTLLYRFAQNDMAQFRVGLGYRFLSDQHIYKSGFNTIYGVDIYPIKPVVVSGEIEWGSLGDASVVHSNIKAGLNYRNLEIFLGYDHLRVGSVRIHGPMCGIRLYF